MQLVNCLGPLFEEVMPLVCLVQFCACICTLELLTQETTHTMASIESPFLTYKIHPGFWADLGYNTGLRIIISEIRA